MPPATQSKQARRILVYGVTGSGKSTAAQRIAARTGLPPTLADELTWAPGWVPVAEDEQRRRMAAVVAQDRWVLDTAYGAWLDVVLPAWISWSGSTTRDGSRSSVFSDVR